MDKPTFPARGSPGPTPTMAQDQAVIGWLATRPAPPDLTRELLLDALMFWEPLLPLPAVTAVPDAGTDVGELLRNIDRRLLAHRTTPTTVRPEWS